MSDVKKIMERIKENDITFVDLRFTDPRGKMQHVTLDIDLIDDDFFAEGTMFDGSSIAGWKAINESDMVLMPDTSRTNEIRTSQFTTYYETNKITTSHAAIY